jgi:hypothetical protein
LEKKMTAMYRTYWRCKNCGYEWSYDSNLDGFKCRCHECGTMTNPKTWECIREAPKGSWGGDG